MKRALHAIRAQMESSGAQFLEFMRSQNLSAGFYRLPAGAVDGQSPHTEDEVYFVVNGAAQMQNGTEEFAVQRGDVIFVAKNVEHRFFEITQDLELLVVFAPPEYANQPDDQQQP